MDYGIIYVKVLPPEGSPAEWMGYCYIFSFYPNSIQQNIKQIVDEINTKYVKDIVIPMNLMLHPGCVTNPEVVEEVATDIFNQYSEMMERHGIKDCVRCVYTIGSLKDVNYDSLHDIGTTDGSYDPVLIKIGHYIDESNQPGLYKI